MQPLSSSEAATLLAPLRSWRHVALAISGGGDSLALMHLAADWAAAIANAPHLHVLTVDHRLHPRSAAVAREVCRQAQERGLPCTILRWDGDKPASGIEQAARHARYALLASWCNRHHAALVTAHTLEDQAETLLMRLARGAGLDGLSAMSAIATVPGSDPPVPLLRPLLAIPRARLRATLLSRGIAWHEDPANADSRFERVRLRQLLPLLARHGFTAAAIATTARRLQRARQALDRLACDFLRRHVQQHPAGWLQVQRDTFRHLPEELQLRVLSHLLGHAGGLGRQLRDMAALERLLRWLHTGHGRARTLAGAILSRRHQSLILTREPGRPRAALQLTPHAPAGRWDNRFAIEATGLIQPLQVTMLHQAPAPRSGDAPPRRPASVPATAWQTQPAIVCRERLLALPASGWQAADAPFATARARPLPLPATGCDESRTEEESAPRA